MKLLGAFVRSAHENRATHVKDLDRTHMNTKNGALANLVRPLFENQFSTFQQPDFVLCLHLGSNSVAVLPKLHRHQRGKWGPTSYNFDVKPKTHESARNHKECGFILYHIIN